MNSFIKNTIIILISLFVSDIGIAQTKNLKVAEVKVYGNCGMCKKKIEKAGNAKGVSTFLWDAKTEMAKITIDSTKTTLDQVLKKIATVGYDNVKYRAADSVYDKLHGCCKYDRPAKSSK
jgi:copper chaperone CopZ